MPPPPTERRRLSVCSINPDLLYRLLISALPFDPVVGARNENPPEAASAESSPVRRTDSVFSNPRLRLYDSQLVRSNDVLRLPRMRLVSALSSTKASIAMGFLQSPAWKELPSGLNTGRVGLACSAAPSRLPSNPAVLPTGAYVSLI